MTESIIAAISVGAGALIGAAIMMGVEIYRHKRASEAREADKQTELLNELLEPVQILISKAEAISGQIVRMRGTDGKLIPEVVLAVSERCLEFERALTPGGSALLVINRHKKFLNASQSFSVQVLTIIKKYSASPSPPTTDFHEAYARLGVEIGYMKREYFKVKGLSLPLDTK